MSSHFPTFAAFFKRHWLTILIGFLCLVVMNLIRIGRTTGFPH